MKTTPMAARPVPQMTAAEAGDQETPGARCNDGTHVRDGGFVSAREARGRLAKARLGLETDKNTSCRRAGAQAWFEHFAMALSGLDVKATKGDPHAFANQEKQLYLTAHARDLHATEPEQLS